MTPETFRNALILTGPTGSGKSRLALTLAGELGAEIVCMDSMTLYRGMDVGTAKPSAEDRARVPHHLLDVLDPWESASVAWWLEQAAACCRDIERRGRRVLFVGGTPLYLKALREGLFDGPPADEAVRARLTDEAQVEGPVALHARLAGVDPVTAARLHPNDVRRVIRALEVWELTGRPLSSWQTQWDRSGSPTVEEAQEEEEVPRCLWLNLPRQHLYQRIDERVGQMVAGGLIEEVRRLTELPRPLKPGGAPGAGLQGDVRPPGGPGLAGGDGAADPDANAEPGQAAGDVVSAPERLPGGDRGFDNRLVGVENKGRVRRITHSPSFPACRTVL